MDEHSSESDRHIGQPASRKTGEDVSVPPPDTGDRSLDPFLVENRWKTIPQIHVSKEKIAFIVLGSKIESENLHRQYGEPELPAVFLCPGKPCSYCTYVQPVKPHILVPVFSIERGEVGVLFDGHPECSSNSAILDIKRLCELPSDGYRIITIRWLSRGLFSATSVVIDDPTDLGFEVADAFLAAYEADRVTLKSAFWQPTEAELLDIPVVQRRKAIFTLGAKSVAAWPTGGDK